MRSHSLLFIIVLFLGITPAFGGYIDFTVAPFDSSIDGQPSWTSPTVDGIEITFTAHPGGATLYWDDNAGYKDGIGIQHSYENDEIESDEILEISFSESVLLSYVNLTDLFNEWGYLETGSYYYSYQGTTSGEIFFSADPLETIGDTYGEYTLGVNQLVDTIYFKAPGEIGAENHEYSVKGIYTSVPEPSTLLLLSTGLLVGAAVRKRLL